MYIGDIPGKSRYGQSPGDSYWSPNVCCRSCDARNFMNGQKNGSPSTNLRTPVSGQTPPHAAGLACHCSRANIRYYLLKPSGWRKHARTYRRSDRHVSIKNEPWINSLRSHLSECEYRLVLTLITESGELA